MDWRVGGSMRGLLVGGMAVALIVSSVALFGCAKSGPNPEQICSAPETYTNLIGIISNDLSGQASAASNVPNDLIEKLKAALDPQKLASSLTFSTPTLGSYNKDNKLVSCDALLSVAGSNGALAHIDKNTSDVNSYDRNHVVYKVAYTVQPAADGGGNNLVYSLSKVNGLNEAILSVIMINSPSNLHATPSPPADDNQSDQSASAISPDGAYGAGGAQDVPPSTIQGAASGMDYGEVRKRILAVGYSPVARDSDGYCEDRVQCKFPEAENCAGTGEAPCEYRFTKDGSILRVLAKGETEDNDPGGQLVYGIIAKSNH